MSGLIFAALSYFIARDSITQMASQLPDLSTSQFVETVRKVKILHDAGLISLVYSGLAFLASRRKSL